MRVGFTTKASQLRLETRKRVTLDWLRRRTMQDHVTTLNREICAVVPTQTRRGFKNTVFGLYCCGRQHKG